MENMDHCNQPASAGYPYAQPGNVPDPLNPYGYSFANNPYLLLRTTRDNNSASASVSTPTYASTSRQQVTPVNYQLPSAVGSAQVPNLSSNLHLPSHSGNAEPVKANVPPKPVQNLEVPPPPYSSRKRKSPSVGNVTTHRINPNMRLQSGGMVRTAGNSLNIMNSGQNPNMQYPSAMSYYGEGEASRKRMKMGMRVPSHPKTGAVHRSSSQSNYSYQGRQHHPSRTASHAYNDAEASTRQTIKQPRIQPGEENPRRRTLLPLPKTPMGTNPPAYSQNEYHSQGPNYGYHGSNFRSHHQLWGSQAQANLQTSIPQPYNTYQQPMPESEYISNYYGNTARSYPTSYDYGQFQVPQYSATHSMKPSYQNTMQDRRSYSNYSYPMYPASHSNSHVPARVARNDSEVPQISQLRRNSGATSQSSEGEQSGSKRSRTSFTPEQTVKLEFEFGHNRYCTHEMKHRLSNELGVTEKQVKIWFQNRRTREKKRNLYSDLHLSKRKGRKSLNNETSSTNSQLNRNSFEVNSNKQNIIPLGSSSRDCPYPDCEGAELSNHTFTSVYASSSSQTQGSSSYGSASSRYSTSSSAMQGLAKGKNYGQHSSYLGQTSTSAQFGNSNYPHLPYYPTLELQNASIQNNPNRLSESVNKQQTENVARVDDGGSELNSDESEIEEIPMFKEPPELITIDDSEENSTLFTSLEPANEQLAAMNSLNNFMDITNAKSDKTELGFPEQLSKVIKQEKIDVYRSNQVNQFTSEVLTNNQNPPRMQSGNDKAVTDHLPDLNFEFLKVESNPLRSAPKNNPAINLQSSHDQNNAEREIFELTDLSPINSTAQSTNLLGLISAQSIMPTNFAIPLSDRVKPTEQSTNVQEVSSAQSAVPTNNFVDPSDDTMFACMFGILDEEKQRNNCESLVNPITNQPEVCELPAIEITSIRTVSDSRPFNLETNQQKPDSSSKNIAAIKKEKLDQQDQHWQIAKPARDSSLNSGNTNNSSSEFKFLLRKTQPKKACGPAVSVKSQLSNKSIPSSISTSASTLSCSTPFNSNFSVAQNSRKQLQHPQQTRENIQGLQEYTCQTDYPSSDNGTPSTPSFLKPVTEIEKPENVMQRQEDAEFEPQNSDSSISEGRLVICMEESDSIVTESSDDQQTNASHQPSDRTLPSSMDSNFTMNDNRPSGYSYSNQNNIDNAALDKSYQLEISPYITEEQAPHLSPIIPMQATYSSNSQVSSTYSDSKHNKIPNSKLDSSYQRVNSPYSSSTDEIPNLSPVFPLQATFPSNSHIDQQQPSNSSRTFVDQPPLLSPAPQVQTTFSSNLPSIYSVLNQNKMAGSNVDNSYQQCNAQYGPVANQTPYVCPTSDNQAAYSQNTYLFPNCSASNHNIASNAVNPCQPVNTLYNTYSSPYTFAPSTMPPPNTFDNKPNWMPYSPSCMYPQTSNFTQDSPGINPSWQTMYPPNTMGNSSNAMPQSSCMYPMPPLPKGYNHVISQGNGNVYHLQSPSSMANWTNQALAAYTPDNINL